MWETEVHHGTRGPRLLLASALFVTHWICSLHSHLMGFVWAGFLPPFPPFLPESVPLLPESVPPLSVGVALLPESVPPLSVGVAPLPESVPPPPVLISPPPVLVSLPPVLVSLPPESIAPLSMGVSLVLVLVSTLPVLASPPLVLVSPLSVLVSPPPESALPVLVSSLPGQGPGKHRLVESMLPLSVLVSVLPVQVPANQQRLVSPSSVAPSLITRAKAGLVKVIVAATIAATDNAKSLRFMRNLLVPAAPVSPCGAASFAYKEQNRRHLLADS